MNADLVAVIVLGFSGSGSPGPNNALLLASGINFGFKRTLPHVVGGAIGVSILVAVSIAGLQSALSALPGSDAVIKIGGSAYLLYLAVRLATSKSLQKGDEARPLDARQAALFQFLNPKAWLFATTVAAAGVPAEGATFVEATFIVGTAMIVATCSFVVWVAGASAIARFIRNEDAVRRLNVGVAVVLVASIAFLWM